jgi:hypothetical protein
VLPKIGAIREAIADAFNANTAAIEAQRDKLADEGAQVWVLNPTGEANRGTRLAGYLEYQGLEASAPRQRPEGGVPATTQVVVFNGAETRLPDTIAYLEKRFKTTVQLRTDQTVRADVVITIGRDTPNLSAPASS